MIKSGECIPDELFVNPNIWHVNVPLVVYITVEMYESEHVLSYSGVYANPFIFTQAPYIPPRFSSSISIRFCFWTSVLKYYTPMASTFLMLTIMYRLSMFRDRLRVPPLCHRCMGHNIIIPICRLCRKYLRDYCSTKMDHLPNHLFLD
ncbi:hypothetical protein Gogos_000688 [Gossypium gossypioides]|uniref:Uncharacterized protein n=1 Tax=Gossypium gossypioides TaxID=34282 RepID=A0A7J9CTF7_GOSGO|nr:hypothetical protein [Gossypium gossypioides]